MHVHGGASGRNDGEGVIRNFIKLVYSLNNVKNLCKGASVCRIIIVHSNLEHVIYKNSIVEP